MSAAVPLTRALARQSRFLVRRQQFRQASSTTEKAGEAASKAKNVASENVSKASEGLSKVTSSAGSSVAKMASSAQSALGRVGGRTGRLIKFVESLIPPTIYYGRVGLELGRLIVQHQKMTPPSIATFQQYFQPLTNALKNPSTITSSMPANGQQLLSQARNASGSQYTTYAVILAQVLGFFTVGEMIGRMKIVGYHGEVHHEH